MTQQSDPKVTMTLAALAATGATPRPSGESLQQQSARILQGIQTQLKNPGLATGGIWEPVWLALSPDNANMAYIARNKNGSNEFAVVMRGTNASLTDILEDLDVGTVVPFTASGSPKPVAVSKGAMEAFTQIANARSIISPAETQATGARVTEAGFPPVGATLLEALKNVLPPTPSATVYVTGHSLGGCLATMIAPYLRASVVPVRPAFALVTFAAPTAGLQSFADYVNSLGWLINERLVNAYDLIPLAWDQLPPTDWGEWYPNPPGPVATDEVQMLLNLISLGKKDNKYAQPGTLAPPLNSDYKLRAEKLVNSTTADFLGQAAFQHANSTYLSLLEAPPIAASPVVTDISPTFGAPGTTVTISGKHFTKEDSKVDFGPVPAEKPDVKSDTQITAVVPQGTGIVDVQVTNMFGTSPTVGMGQFAYGGPAPVVVSAVDPTNGNVGTQVTIKGSGFTREATVQFSGVPATPVTFVSPNQIKVPAPKQDPQTVDVTVAVGEVTSPTSTDDEFTYTGS
jgi:hypothetical protein